MDAVLSLITDDLQRGKLSHAILIDGGTQEQRESLAYAAAQAAVCEGNVKPGGKCIHCVKAAARSHPDILFFSGGQTPGSFKVDTIREIRQSASIVPNEAASKVYILHNAQGMAPAAQNALLKILEEPPRFVRFILTCPSDSLMLQTILSRVTVYSIPSEGADETDPQYREASELAEKILLAVSNRDEVEALRLTAAFEGDKALFSLCCSCMYALTARALLCRYTDTASDDQTAAELSSRISASELLKIQELCANIIDNIQNNINVNLLMTYFCARLMSGQDGRN